jgi:GTP cyclohydrolase II
MSEKSNLPDTGTKTPGSEANKAGFVHVSSARLPTRWGEFTLHAFENAAGQEHIALTVGDLSGDEPPLSRIHSECLTGDALFSLRCDCGAQLQRALQQLAEKGRGILFYLRQEGRGIGLVNKVRAYHLQDAGADTVEANQHLGFDADLRSYEAVADICRHFGIRQLALMTNNPAKVEALQQLGIAVPQRLPIRIDANPHNRHYLQTKADKMRHLLKNEPE